MHWVIGAHRGRSNENGDAPRQLVTIQIERHMIAPNTTRLGAVLYPVYIKPDSTMGETTGLRALHGEAISSWSSPRRDPATKAKFRACPGQVARRGPFCGQHATGILLVSFFRFFCLESSGGRTKETKKPFLLFLSCTFLLFLFCASFLLFPAVFRLLGPFHCFFSSAFCLLTIRTVYIKITR